MPKVLWISNDDLTDLEISVKIIEFLKTGYNSIYFYDWSVGRSSNSFIAKNYRNVGDARLGIYRTITKDSASKRPLTSKEKLTIRRQLDLVKSF